MKNRFTLLLEKKLLLAFCGGILFSIPYLFPQLFLISLLGVALMFLSIHSETKSEKMFRKGFLFGLGFYIPLYHWFIALYPFEAFSFTEAQGIAIIIISALGISIYHSLFLGFSIFLLGKINAKREFLPFGLAVAFMFDEWIISLGVLGFSWGRTAIGQIYALPILQTASLFGLYFITFIIFLSGAYLGYAIVSNEKRKLYSIIGASIYLLNFIIGCVFYFIPERTETTVNASIIQGNISIDEKWVNGGNYSIEYYLSELKNIAQNGDSDIIVLPESCFPIYMDDEHYIIAEIREIAKENNISVAFGCIYRADDGAHNSLYLVNEHGEKVGIYSKRHLVPFGEFLPYEEVLENLEFIKNLNLGNISYIQGEEATVLETENGIKYGSLVCFDSIFPELSRECVTKGAELINVITNDSWYKDTRGVYQHAAYSQLLAIQNGRYVIRSANTGISMFIDSKGNVIDYLPPLVQGTITSSVSTISTRTLYSYIGDIFYPLTAFIYLAFQIVIFLKRRLYLTLRLEC